ncbi:hypothetical protein KTI57_18425, partial [Acinetobacter pittii]|uniref:condensation domain-containing protein n=1 Tax=Acinetobacter pittii TaxID=48296 RepID=UPI0021CF4333
IEELKNALKDSLPPYMVPGTVILINEFPLTPNSKIDRLALLKIDSTNKNEREESDVALTDLQSRIARIWERLLKIDRIGIKDNFFEYGGHSLLGVRLIAHIQRELEFEIPINVLFDEPTIEGIASYIEEERAKKKLEDNNKAKIKRGTRSTNVPMSFAQERLWFLEQLSSSTALYNIPMVMRLNGPLNTEALEWALNELVKRHEVLRTGFSLEDDNPVQVINHEVFLDLPFIDLSGLPEAERESEIERIIGTDSKRPFDLGQAPLIRMQLIQSKIYTHILYINIHHLIFDEWSINNFTSQLAQFYNIALEKRMPNIAALPIQYADFSQWQRDWLQGEE